MKAIFINGSPRKKGNTAELLSKTMQGASDAGCETKMIHLRDLKFTGCISCLACKIKGNKCGGLCALRDDLRPVLEETLTSDILVIGTPVYWHYPTALTRAFMERLLFAPLDYANPGSSVLKKKIRCATIYTMHVMNDELFEKMDYAQTLGLRRSRWNCSDRRKSCISGDFPFFQISSGIPSIPNSPPSSKRCTKNIIRNTSVRHTS